MVATSYSNQFRFSTIFARVILSVNSSGRFRGKSEVIKATAQAKTIRSAESRLLAEVFSLITVVLNRLAN